MNFIFYIVLIILIKVLWKYVHYTPESEIFSRSYGSRKENMDTLLNRIDWANSYKSRISYMLRYLFCAILVTFIILFVYENKFPNGFKLLQCVFVSWIVIFAFYQYTQHHSDKYAHYAIDRNVDILRKQYKIKKSIPSKSNISFELNSDCLNFVFN